MPILNFSFDIDDGTYQAVLGRAQAEGISLEQAVAALIGSYAKGDAAQNLTSYTVQRGDSLSRIARQVYGDPHKYPLIQEANNLTDPGRIWIGQVLVIPAVGGSPPVPAPAPSVPAVPTAPPTAVPSIGPGPSIPPSPPTPAPAPTPAPSPPVPAPPSTPSPPAPTPEPPAPEPEPTPTVDPCAPIEGVNYATLPVVGPPTDRPAAEHGDINLALRGFNRVGDGPELGIINMAGDTDSGAPQLAGLFADNRTPTFTNLYRVNIWDWATNSRGGPIDDHFEANMAGFKVEPGEIIHVPESGYEIGQGNAVLVLYAAPERITIKYTGEDNVINGYTIHVEGICVDPNLVGLYDQMNGAGRGHLPALKARQPFGRSRGNEIQVVIRDVGRFMDPRVRQGWWMDR